MPFKSEKQRRFLWKNKPELAEKWAHKYGSKVKKKKGWKKIVDNKMKDYGDIDEEKKVIRIRKKPFKKKSWKKDEVVDTIVHEELHAKHPKMHEKTVYKKAKKMVGSMPPRQKKKLCSSYNFSKAEKRLGIKY